LVRSQHIAVKLKNLSQLADYWTFLRIAKCVPNFSIWRSLP